MSTSDENKGYTPLFIQLEIITINDCELTIIKYDKKVEKYYLLSCDQYIHKFDTSNALLGYLKHAMGCILEYHVKSIVIHLDTLHDDSILSCEEKVINMEDYHDYNLVQFEKFNIEQKLSTLVKKQLEALPLIIGCSTASRSTP